MEIISRLNIKKQGEEKMSKDIDKMFEKMSRECANKMNGTHPPKTPKIAKTIKTTKKGK